MRRMDIEYADEMELPPNQLREVRPAQRGDNAGRARVHRARRGGGNRGAARVAENRIDEEDIDQPNDLVQRTQTLATTEDAITHLCIPIKQDLGHVRELGAPDELFQNPNITGDLTPVANTIEADTADLTIDMGRLDNFVMNFTTGFLQVGSSQDARLADRLDSVANVAGKDEREADAFEGRAIRDDNLLERMVHMICSAIFKQAWEFAQGASETRQGLAYKATRDMSSKCPQYRIISNSVQELKDNLTPFIRLDFKFIKNLIAMFDVPISDILIRTPDQQMKNLGDIKDVAEKTLSFTRQKGRYMDFAFFAHAYAAIRTVLAKNDFWRKENKVMDGDRLASWQREDVDTICQSSDERKQFGKMDKWGRPPADKFVAAYGGQRAEHTNTLPFLVYPKNVPPRLRNQETFDACCKYVSLLSNGEVNQDVIFKTDLDVQFQNTDALRAEAHSYAQKYFLFSTQSTLRNTIEYEKARISITALISLLGTSNFSDDATPPQLITRMIELIPAEAIIWEFAAIESLECLFYGFLHSGLLSMTQYELEKFGLTARADLYSKAANPHLDNLKAAFGTCKAELFTKIPAGTTRRVDDPDEVKFDWVPPAYAEMKRNIYAAAGHMEQSEKEAALMVALEAMREGKNSKPLAGEKNDSIEWVYSKETSFIEDYELLPILISEKTEGKAIEKRIKLAKMRYSAVRNNQGQIIVKQKIAGADFAPLSMNLKDKDAGEIHPQVLKEMQEARAADAQRQREEVLGLIQRYRQTSAANMRRASQASKEMAQVIANNYDFIKRIAACQGNELRFQRLRKEIDTRYFAPTNITNKAMAKVMLSMLRSDQDETELTFGLPHLEVARVHFESTGLEPKEYAKNAAIGCRRKEWMQEVELLEGMGDIGNIGDMQAAEALEDMNSDIDEEEREIEVDGAMMHLNERAQSGSGVTVKPLLYSSRYTYEVIFYLAQVFQGVVYPMGKTYPDLGWVYAALDIMDPKDEFCMRLNNNQALVSIGGLRLLDAYTAVVSSSSPNLAALVARIASTGTGTEDGSLLHLATQTAASVHILCRQASQIKGEITYLESSFNVRFDELVNLEGAVSGDPRLKLVHIEECSKYDQLRVRLEGGISRRDATQLIASKLGLQNREPLSADQVLYFADLGYAQFIANVRKACEQFRDLRKGAQNADVYWLLSTLLEANSNTSYDISNPKDQQLFWTKTVEPLLTLPKLKFARQSIVGSQDLCDRLLSQFRRCSKYAVENSLEIGIYRPNTFSDRPKIPAAQQHNLLKMIDKADDNATTIASTRGFESLGK